MRMTVSLCVIMVEITNNLKLLPLIMLVLLISKVCFKEPCMLVVDFPWTILSVYQLQAVGDAFNEGLYEEQARLRGIPLLESRPKYQMRKMTAKEACGNKKVLCHLNAFMWSFYAWFWHIGTEMGANIIYLTRILIKKHIYIWQECRHKGNTISNVCMLVSTTTIWCRNKIMLFGALGV